MAELNTAEADNAAAVLASFDEGFTGTPPAPAAKVVEEPKAEPEPKAANGTAPAPKPEYIRVTRQEWDNSKAALGKIPTLESALAKLTGSIPKADAIIQQVIEKVQSQTPAGHAVEFSKEDLAELAEDYPELAVKLERVLNKGKVKGTGPAEGEAPKPSAAASDPDAIRKAVDAALKERADAAAAEARQKETDALLAAHPDWGKIVGQPLAMGTTEPVKTEWRTWLETQSAEYQKEVGETDSPAVIQASIDKFMASKTAPVTPPKPTKADVRREVIEAGVTPRADTSGQPLTPPPSVEDAFEQGFKTK